MYKSSRRFSVFEEIKMNYTDMNVKIEEKKEEEAKAKAMAAEEEIRQIGVF